MSRRQLVSAWRDAIRDSDLDRIAKLVAFVISTYMNARAWAFPSKETIARGASLAESRRAVDNAVGRLERAGYLRVERSKGRRPNRYKTASKGYGIRWIDETGQRRRQAGFSSPSKARTWFRDIELVRMRGEAVGHLQLPPSRVQPGTGRCWPCRRRDAIHASALRAVVGFSPLASRPRTWPSSAVRA